MGWRTVSDGGRTLLVMPNTISTDSAMKDYQKVQINTG